VIVSEIPRRGEKIAFDLDPRAATRVFSRLVAASVLSALKRIPLKGAIFQISRPREKIALRICRLNEVVAAELPGGTLSRPTEKTETDFVLLTPPVGGATSRDSTTPTVCRLAEETMHDPYAMAQSFLLKETFPDDLSATAQSTSRPGDVVTSAEVLATKQISRCVGEIAKGE